MAVPGSRYPVVARMKTEPDWIDYNGHMRDGFYAVAFSAAIDALMEEFGLDRAYREDTGHTLEIHLRYLAEVKQDERLTVRVRLLGLDEKRLHLLLAMERGDGTVVCAQDTMLLHVDQGAGRAAPFPPAIGDRLAALLEAHLALDPDPHMSRVIALGAGRT